MKSKTIRIIGAALILVALVAFFSSRLVLLASERESKAPQSIEAESAALMENCCKKMKAAPPPAEPVASTDSPAGLSHCASCSKHKTAQ